MIGVSRIDWINKTPSWLAETARAPILIYVEKIINNQVVGVQFLSMKRAHM